MMIEENRNTHVVHQDEQTEDVDEFVARITQAVQELGQYYDKLEYYHSKIIVQLQEIKQLWIDLIPYIGVMNQAEFAAEYGEVPFNEILAYIPEVLSMITEYRAPGIDTDDDSIEMSDSKKKEWQELIEKYSEASLRLEGYLDAIKALSIIQRAREKL